MFFLSAYEISDSGSVMLSLCLIFQGTRLPVWEKFNSNVAAKCEYEF